MQWHTHTYVQRISCYSPQLAQVNISSQLIAQHRHLLVLAKTHWRYALAVLCAGATPNAGAVAVRDIWEVSIAS